MKHQAPASPPDSWADSRADGQADGQADGRVRCETIDGCDVFVLESDLALATIVPSRGARLASLVDRVTGFEWMWRPKPEIVLPACVPGSGFEHGPLVGADECIPTVGACDAGGRDYPDHGEAWARAWDVRTNETSVVTRVELACAPMSIERTATLRAGELALAYRVDNLSEQPIPWLWSWHPLMVIPGAPTLSINGFADAMRVDNGAGVPMDGQAWSWAKPSAGIDLTHLELGPGDRSVKLFLERVSNEASVSIADAASGSTLTVSLEGEHLRGLGLWISRGGWNGTHHVAIEPTTLAHERPTDPGVPPGDAMLGARERVEFSIRVGLSR